MAGTRSANAAIGSGAGRVYTITVTATDAAGQTTQASVQVLVPTNGR